MSRNTDENWTIGNYKTNRYREVVGKKWRRRLYRSRNIR